MDVLELLRRWQAGDSQRAIARQTGLARETVKQYLVAARAAGLRANGPPPDEPQLAKLARRTHPAPKAGTCVGRIAPRVEQLAPYRDQIAHWLRDDRLQLTRVQELLGQREVRVTYTTLRRFVRDAGLGKAPRTTVRMADTAPGDVAEMDFGKFGALVDPHTGQRIIVWALVVVLAYSRHSFVWPLVQQTLEAVVEGLEATWRFFGGIPQRLVLDNFPAAVAGPDPLAPRPTREFREYSQARGFLVDAARIRHPQDKPHVERGISYVRERFWKGGTFRDLADVRDQAGHWCRDIAGQRVHGTTHKLPLVVFEDEERAHLRPFAPDTAPYDVPVWKTVTVQADHHVTFGQALYSLPAMCPPRTTLEARGDRSLVRFYKEGEVVKVHPRQPKGGRATDPEDYPPERATYALRAPDRLILQALRVGPHVGEFARQLLSGTFPWAKLRQGQKLLRLGEHYTDGRLEAACARALAFELLDVRRVERILVLALEREQLPVPPLAERLRFLPSVAGGGGGGGGGEAVGGSDGEHGRSDDSGGAPSSRFARPGSAFAHLPDAPYAFPTPPPPTQLPTLPPSPPVTPVLTPLLTSHGDAGEDIGR
jgi:transposase